MTTQLKERLSIIFLVSVIVTITCGLFFMLHYEYSKTKVTVHDNIYTETTYETRRGNKVLLYVNRKCDVTGREYEDAIVITIKLKNDELPYERN